MSKLKPPKNFRDAVPRCCATCERFVLVNDQACTRPDGPKWVLFSDRTWFVICDLYKKHEEYDD